MASEPDQPKTPRGSTRRQPVTLDAEATGEAAKPAPKRRSSRAAAANPAETTATTPPADPAPAEPPAADAPTTDAPLTPPAAAPEDGGGDWTRAALLAVLGGVAAVLLLYLLAAIGLAPFLSDGSGRQALDATEQLRTELASVAARPEDDSAARLAALAERIGRLEDNLAGLGTKVEGLAAGLGEIDTKVDGLATTGAAAPPNLAAVEGRIEILAERLNRLGEAPDLDGELAARIARIEDELKQPPAPAGPNAAVLIAALRVAAESGAPYRAELQALAGVGIDQATRQTLERHADGGVPARATLIADYGAVEQAMRAALPQPTAEGWFGRLFKGAERLVEVRPVEPVAGSAPAAVLSRLGAWVERGRLAAALTERADLPAEALAASAEWAAEVADRVALDQAVAALAEAARTAPGNAG